MFWNVIQEAWFEGLEKSEDALNSFTKNLDKDPKPIKSILGGMNFLHALGEWELQSEMVQEHSERSSSGVKRTMAPLAAAAMWGSAKWDSMYSYINTLNSDFAEKVCFKTILSFHCGQHTISQELINKDCDTFDPELSTFLEKAIVALTSQFQCSTPVPILVSNLL
ncbi:hypothetical protein O181_011969 [Austropuccinia psidii MF-1]|uniref:PIK-related kinase FAT domain-containing protein n=1 Tax=Austropuccinia psidii MF-1 TaxID=1389203 RepID=A0A9Q3GME0_9BASI|nr:hypothetical protein [Austropuccinia psidii MF-1]